MLLVNHKCFTNILFMKHIKEQCSVNNCKDKAATGFASQPCLCNYVLSEL